MNRKFVCFIILLAGFWAAHLNADQNPVELETGMWLRFDLSRLLGHGVGIHPTVSLLQIKFGPFYYDGRNPSWFDMGNFVAVVDLIRIGVFYKTKGK